MVTKTNYTCHRYCIYHSPPIQSRSFSAWISKAAGLDCFRSASILPDRIPSLSELFVASSLLGSGHCNHMEVLGHHPWCLLNSGHCHPAPIMYPPSWQNSLKTCINTARLWISIELIAHRQTSISLSMIDYRHAIPAGWIQLSWYSSNSEPVCCSAEDNWGSAGYFSQEKRNMSVAWGQDTAFLCAFHKHAGLGMLSADGEWEGWPDHINTSKSSPRLSDIFR